MLQSIPWQEVIVGFCVLAAVFFLARRWLFPGAKKSGCGSCSACDKNAPSACAPSNSDKTH